MPFAFESSVQKYQIPNEHNYDYLIYSLPKLYQISPKEAGQMTELDYWKALGFNNTDVKNCTP